MSDRPFIVYSDDFTDTTFTGAYSWRMHDDGDLTVIDSASREVVAGFARGKWVKVIPFDARENAA